VEAFNAAREASGHAPIDLSTWDGDIPACPENNARFITSLKMKRNELYAFLKQGISNLAENEIATRAHEHYFYKYANKAFLTDINWGGVTLNPKVFAATYTPNEAEFFNAYRTANPDAPIDMSWINNVPTHNGRYVDPCPAHLKNYNLSGLDLTGITSIAAALKDCRIEELHHAHVTQQQALTLLNEHIFDRYKIINHLAINGVVPPEPEIETTAWKDIRKNHASITPTWFYDQSFSRDRALTALWPGDADTEKDLNGFQHGLGGGPFSDNKEWRRLVIGGLSYIAMENVYDNKTIRQYIADSGQAIHATIEEAAAELKAKATSAELPSSEIRRGASSKKILQAKVPGLV
jgi:hypothetical protein